MVWSTIKEIQNIKISEILEGRSQDVLTWIHGAPYGRSAMSEDPSTLVNSDPMRLQARFQNRHGYALFQDKLYLVQFGWFKPNVTLLSIAQDDLETIRSSFPPESAPLATFSEAEFHALHDYLDPMPNLLTEDFSFNIELLSPYFKDINRNGLPFIEFSDIGLVSVSNLTTREDLPAVVENILQKRGPYQDLTENFFDLPLIIKLKNQCFLYGNTQGDVWSFTELDANLLKQHPLPFTASPSRLSFDSQYFPLYQHIFEKRGHTYFSTQPQQVTQLKKLLNSAYYFKLMVQDFESMDFSFSTLNKVWTIFSDYWSGTLYDKAYRALSLITDVELNYVKAFHEEIAEFQIILDRFKYYSKNGKAYLPETEAAAPFLAPGKYQPSYSFQAANAVGFATRYIYDPNGQWDTEVLSQFSVDFPTHIDEITTWINANTSNVKQYAPNIDAAQLRSLQNEANKLLKTLKNTQSNMVLNKSNPFNPLRQMAQIFNYILLISHILKLLTTTLTQVGHLNEAYQELLRTYLQILKTAILILEKHVIRVEIETIGAPAITRPFLRKLTEYYDFIADHVKGLADFKFRGENLLVLEDACFTHEREANILAILKESQVAQQKIIWAQTAAQEFFTGLSSTDRRSQQETYAYFAPYMEQINPNLNQQMINVLQNPHANLTVLSTQLSTIRGRLFAYLTQLQTTESLRQQQIHHILAAIPKYTNIQVFPYYDQMGCDITLKIVRNISLQKLKLPHNNPMLIQHHYRGQISYVFYGNTDGTRWDFSSPIEKQFLDTHIQHHFTKLARMMTAADYQPNLPYIVHYHRKYESLYQQMINKKAHTHYRSQLSSLESEALSDDKQSLTSMIFKPLDWVEARLNHQPQPLNTTLTPEQTLPDTMIVHVNATTDRIRDIHQLSADQALNMYVWYQQKITAYKQATDHILQFQRLINQHFRPEATIQFTVSSITHKLCQYYYYKIQPYCIGITNFPHFDQRMVQALSLQTRDAHAPSRQLPPPKWPPITCNELNQILNQFSVLAQAQPLITSWETRAELILCRARTAYQEEQIHALTTRCAHIEVNPRANYLLKTTIVSTKIKEFRESVGLWALAFHDKVQNELKLHFILTSLNEEEFTKLKTLLDGVSPKLTNCQYHRYARLTFTVQELKIIRIRLETTPEGLILSQKFVLKPHLYEEVDNLNKQLEQTPLVLLAKRIFNTLYHLQHIAEGLEDIPIGTMPDARAETIHLVSRVFTQHGIPLKDLIVPLRQDPLLAKLGTDLYQQYEYILQQLGDLIQPHTTPPAQVLSPGEEPVMSNGLWYVMNSFYMLPHQLLSLTEQRDRHFGYGIHLITDTNERIATPPHRRLSLIQHHQQYYIYSNGRGNAYKLRRVPTELITPLNIDFTQEHLDYHHQYQALYDFLGKHHFHFTPMNDLQVSAMQSTKNIESIIQNAIGNRYFKLFLSLPMIYRLNQNLQAQAETFTRTTQEVVMSHLEILQTDYFAPLMVLADTKEHEWGLNHGELTGPMQAIIDELNQGLVFQLKFEHFRNREDLIVNEELLLARILAEEKRLASFSNVNEEHANHYGIFQLFKHNIERFNAGLFSFESSVTGYKPIPDPLNQQYQADILPKLQAHQHEFIPELFRAISPRLETAQLTIIKNQISQYHQSLSALFLVHNAADRKLYESLQPFLARLNEQPLPNELAVQYTDSILPALVKYRNSFIPDWLKEIPAILNRDTLSKVQTQAFAYFSHLKGLEQQRKLQQALSNEKLQTLWQKLGVSSEVILSEHPNFAIVEDPETHESLPLKLTNIEAFRPGLVNCREAIERNSMTKKQQYRQLFGKHYFYNYLNHLPYKASGLKHAKIHRSFHHELRRYLIHHEAEILQNVANQDAVDTYLDELIQSRIETFKLLYFARYQRLDQVQTAVNEFKTYLNRDQRIPTDLRNTKLRCLSTIEDIIAQRDRGDVELDTFLNHRSQLLCESIHSAENTLLEHYPQFSNIFDWLIDCLISLFTAMGLYTPERQRRYANLVASTQPQQHLPTGWQRFMNFRPAEVGPNPAAPRTPPREARILTPLNSIRRL